MIDYDDYFGGLTEEEYVRQTEEHFEWLENNMRDAMPEELQSIEEYIGSIPVPTGISFYDNFDTPSVCNNCNNNPKNGGSGICNCILGQQTLY